MRGKRTASDRALAAEVWRRLFAVFMASRPERDRVLKRLGLSTNDAKALHALDPESGQPMRVLADCWCTDASNATWIVDRLERLGLAERRSTEEDRRVKLVVLTPRGTKTREQLLRAFHVPPAELTALGERDLRTLNTILAKLTAEPDQS